MWVLVELFVVPLGISAFDGGHYNTMEECFHMRDQILIREESWDGIPPINTQYVCVRTDYNAKL